jgi:hypothetical protein
LTTKQSPFLQVEQEHPKSAVQQQKAVLYELAALY